MVSEKTLLKDKNGRSYIYLNLKDVSGTIEARMWDNADETNKEIQDGDIVRVKGKVQTFQNRKQIILHTAKKAPSEDYNDVDFWASTPFDVMGLKKELNLFIGSIKDARIRSLIEIILTEERQQLLLSHPAAKSIHHSYRGGLIEHIVSICRILDFISNHYGFLDRDLLIFGAIFHDIGKLEELSVSGATTYTNRGRMLGHMGIVIEWINESAVKIEGFDEELKTKLNHIILSHHNKMEYGSPKRPKFLEAMVIAMVDELDSKINQLKNFMTAELASGESWSRYNQSFDRYFYLDIFRDQLERMNCEKLSEKENK